MFPGLTDSWLTRHHCICFLGKNVRAKHEQVLHMTTQANTYISALDGFLLDLFSLMLHYLHLLIFSSDCSHYVFIVIFLSSRAVLQPFAISRQFEVNQHVFGLELIEILTFTGITIWHLIQWNHSESS